MQLMKMRSNLFVVAAVLCAVGAQVGCGGGSESESALNSDPPRRTGPPADSNVHEPRGIANDPDSASRSQADREDLAKARELLADVARTYREAPALTDELTVHGQGRQQVMTIRLSPRDERVEVILPSASAYAIDDTFYATSALMFDLYLELPLEGDMAAMLRNVMQWTPTYHFAMREGEDVESYLPGLGLGLLRTPRLTGHSIIVDDTGEELHRVHLEASNGIAYVHIDPERKVVTGIMMELLPGPDQPAQAPRQDVRIHAEPKFADALDEPVVFDPGDREAVHDVSAMEPRPLRPGDRVPNFVLQTSDGDSVTMRDLRGEVVVLDFWATWCVPCLMALPQLDRFAKWAEGRESVKVYAVNTMERAATVEERLAMADEYWSSKEFAVPMLFDPENLNVMRTGFMTLPLTLVVDPQGRISRIHDGFSRDMYQILKADSEKALREVEQEPAGK